MKLNPKIAGVIILLPIVALEAIIKGLLFLLYYPAEIIAIIFYPCFKRTNIDKIFNKWYKYAFNKYFYTATLVTLWEN